MAARKKPRHGKSSSRKKKRVPPYGDKPRTSSKLTGSAKKPFKFLDHPADVGFVAHGKTLPKTFAAAAQALCDFGWELKNVQPRRQVEIRARAATLEDLLYSWLSEILFLTDAEQWVFRRFQIHEVREQSEKEKGGTERLTAEAQRARRKSDHARTGIAATEFPTEPTGPSGRALGQKPRAEAFRTSPGLGESQGAWEIRATAQGEKFVPARHRSRTYIKAVTYHQLSVKKTRTGWQATVFLDV